MFRRQAQIRLVKEVIGKATGMQHELARGDVGFRRAQYWLPCPIKTFNYFQRTDGRRVLFGWRIQIQEPFFYALQRGGAGNGFCCRHDREDRVFGHSFTIKTTLASGACVNIALAIGNHRYDTRHASSSITLGKTRQQAIASLVQVAHLSPPCLPAGDRLFDFFADWAQQIEITIAH